jgi:hypothetical protein
MSEGWERAVIFFVGLAVIWGIAFAMYKVAPPTPKRLYTGANCPEIINRLWAQRDHHVFTSAEHHDLEICTDP